MSLIIREANSDIHAATYHVLIEARSLTDSEKLNLLLASLSPDKFTELRLSGTQILYCSSCACFRNIYGHMLVHFSQYFDNS